MNSGKEKHKYKKSDLKVVSPERRKDPSVSSGASSSSRRSPSSPNSPTEFGGHKRYLAVSDIAGTSLSSWSETVPNCEERLPDKVAKGRSTSTSVLRSDAHESGSVGRPSVRPSSVVDR